MQKGPAAKSPPSTFSPGTAAFVISSQSMGIENQGGDSATGNHTHFSSIDMERQAFLRTKLRTAVPAPRLTVKGMEASWEQGETPVVPVVEKQPRAEGNMFGRKCYPTNSVVSMQNALSSPSPRRRKRPTPANGGNRSGNNRGYDGGRVLRTSAKRSLSRSPSAKEHEDALASGAALPMMCVYSSPAAYTIQRPSGGT